MGWQDAPEVGGAWASAPEEGARTAPAPKPVNPNIKPSAEKGGTLGGLFMGAIRDPLDGITQMAARAANYLPAAVLARIVSPDGVVAQGLDNMVRDVDASVKNANDEYDASRRLNAGGAEPGFDAARLAGNVVSPVNMLPGAQLERAVRSGKGLVTAGARAGAISAAAQPVVDPGDNFAGQKAMQVGAGAAGGAVLSPVVGSVAGGIARRMQGGAAARAAPDVNVAANNLLRDQGMNINEVPAAVRESVVRQIGESFSNNTKIDPASILRRAEFEAVGLTDDAAPTLGQMTRDPMQFAQEKNLSGLNVAGNNELAARFQNQNQRLSDVFDQIGASTAVDRNTAGQTLIQALREADVPVRSNVDNLYTAARNMSEGRMADLDRNAFSTAANSALDESMANAFVPSSVRTLLNDISAGKGPFNVESAVQIDSLLSQSQRQAERSGDNAAAFAIGKIRTALQDTPFAEVAPVTQAAGNAGESAAAQAARTVDEGITDVPFREMPARPELPSPAGSDIAARQQPQYSRINDAVATVDPAVNEGQAAREAFEQARRAARSRFATIEETPALKAALDEAAPDKFVQRYIFGADARDVSAMKKVLDNSPEAWAQARSQVANYLKRAAYGENPSGDKAFSSDRYLKTLDAFGKQKLEMFFSPDEVVRLKLAGKVASDINSIPVGARYGTNTSGTAATAVNTIMGILDRIPGGKFVSVPLNFAKNEYATMQTQKAIQNALNAQPEQIGQELTPEMLRRIGLAATASASAGGAATGGMLR